MKRKLTDPTAPVKPPPGLSDRSQALWAAVVQSGRADTTGRQALLAETLAALDRAAECREAVDRDGMMLTTPRSGVQHAHPLLALEVTFRRQFLSGAKQLDLNANGDGDDFFAQFVGVSEQEDDA